jgi:hypothetical protein
MSQGSPIQACREGVPAIDKPTNIVKKAVNIKLNNWFWDERNLNLPYQQQSIPIP